VADVLKCIGESHVLSEVDIIDKLGDAEVGTIGKALRLCYRNGWLVLDEDDNRNHCYALPSPLHEYYVMRMVSRVDVVPKAVNLYGLCLATIRRFNPPRLRNPSYGCMGPPSLKGLLRRGISMSSTGAT
jgi:hypothetical protein